MADDRVGTEFQGETAGTGSLPGVQEGNGEGVTGGAPPNPEQRGERVVGEGGRQESRGEISQGIQDDGSGKGRTYTLLS